MNKSPNSTISRLKQPSMIPLPKYTAVLQSINRNNIYEDPRYIRPAKRMLSRRSNSFSDLQTILKPKKQCYNKPGMHTISKHLLTSSSTTDLNNKGKKPTLHIPTLHIPSKLPKPLSIPETSKVIKPGTSTSTATLKRPVVNSSEEISKPKVSKPAKSVPYDYEARYNLLSEKQSFVQTNKETKEELVNAKKKLDTFATLGEARLKTTSKSELQEQYEALSQDHGCIKQERDNLGVALNNAKKTIKYLQCELQNRKTIIQSHEESRRAMHNQIQCLKGIVRVFCRKS